MAWPQSSNQGGQPVWRNESELREYIRRADKFPDRKGSLRREALKCLISTAQSADPALKKVVTEKVKDFFVDFPDLQDEAINAVYDLCEDQDQSVRILGYGAITSVSRVARHWLLRNADVLVQLLQSDDEREVAVVKRALQEHVDIEPSDTLRMLCDQCSFDAEKMEDEDERALRLRLRNLVVGFLSEKYRGCISRVVKDPEVEKVVARGLLPALGRATPSERRTLKNDILINLPSFNSPNPNNELFDIIIESTRSTLGSELSSETRDAHSDLKGTLAILHLLSIISAGKTPNEVRPTAARLRRSVDSRSPARLLDFYFSLLAPEGPLSGKKLVDAVTPLGCIYFAFYFGQILEGDGVKQSVEATNVLTDRLTQLLEALFTQIVSPEAESCLHISLKPTLTLLRAFHKHMLKSRGTMEVPPSLRAVTQQVQLRLTSIGPPSGAPKEVDYDNETLPTPTTEEVTALLKDISDIIRNLVDIPVGQPNTPGDGELCIKGQAPRPVSIKRRLEAERDMITASTSMEVDQDISVRGAAKLAEPDVMDVDSVQSSAVESPVGVKQPYDSQSSRARKRRKGRNNEGVETTSPAASSASAIKAQQRMESPSLLSRLQGKPFYTASPPQDSTHRQNSGSTRTSLAARLYPIANGDSGAASTPTLTNTTSNDLFARLVMPSPGRSDRDTLSSSSSNPSKSIVSSHDYSPKRHSEQGSGPNPVGQSRQRFIRGGLSIKGTASLATDMSDSLDNKEGEIKIRGAAQRVSGDHPDNAEASQPVSLLARLGNGGGGIAGKNGVGARGHRKRQ